TPYQPGQDAAHAGQQPQQAPAAGEAADEAAAEAKPAEEGSFPMPKFFINHPVFAWVVAILISLAGVISILGLGVESYPNIAPPQVTVSATYPGASAETVEKAVTQVIEQQLT